jgi:hypothetical protein
VRIAGVEQTEKPAAAVVVEAAHRPSSTAAGTNGDSGARRGLPGRAPTHWHLGARSAASSPFDSRTRLSIWAHRCATGHRSYRWIPGTGGSPRAGRPSCLMTA